MPTPKSDYSAIRVIASPDGTAVLDANRKSIPGIIGIDVALRAQRPPVMRVNMLAGNVDIVGHPVFAVADPATGQLRLVRKILWLDGQEWEAPPLPPEYVPVPGEMQPAPAAPGAEQNGAAIDGAAPSV